MSEMKKLPDTPAMDEAMRRYLQQDRERCAGDFDYWASKYTNWKPTTFPVKAKGRCTCGETLTATGTREDFEKATVMAFCKKCQAHVAPAWNLPWDHPEPQRATPVYTVGIDMAEPGSTDQSCVVTVKRNPDGSMELVSVDLL